MSIIIEKIRFLKKQLYCHSPTNYDHKYMMTHFKKYVPNLRKMDGNESGSYDAAI